MLIDNRTCHHAYIVVSSFLIKFLIRLSDLYLSQRLDINGDGQVSPSELRKALKFMDIRVDKAVCARMVYDFNDEGFLDIDIFMDMVTELFRKGYLDPITVRSFTTYRF